jgi:hypothetical protein
MWDTVFSLANLLTAVGWIALIALPRKPALLAAVMYLGIGLLCLVYAVAVVGLLSGLIDPGGPTDASANFFTIDGVRTIFASDGGVTIGWVHYLAFDLFVGLWIARDADAKAFSRLAQAPVLIATYLAGPVGLLIWFVARERRARASGRWS